MSNQKVAINGAKWTSTATIITTVLSFVQLALIARVLDPSIFGLVSICSLVADFFHIFANLGFTNSIISTQESNRGKLSTIFFSSVGLGTIMCVAIYFSAGLVVSYYNEPRLLHVIRVSAFTFPLLYTSQIYWNLLQKELNFKMISIVEVITGVIAFIVIITLAYNDFQELSVIYGQLISIAVRTILYVIIGSKLFRPIFYFKLKEIKDHLRFGMYHMGEGILGFVNGNIENVVIGKAIGLKELGLYTIAYQLAIFPIYKLNPIIMQVSYPIMAKMKENEGLRRAYLKITDFITCCNFPLLAGMFITSTSVVILIYGDDYQGSIPLIKVILIVSFLACVTAPVPSLALSKGKPNIMFFLNLSTLLIKIPTIYFMSKYFGLMGIVWGFVFSCIIETTMQLSVVNHLLKGEFFKIFLSNLMKPLLFCLIMVIAVFIYQGFIGTYGVVNVLVQISIGALVYIGLMLKFKISLSEILGLKKSL